MTAEVPPGFEPHIRKSPVTDPWEPLYAKRDGEAFSLGLRIAHSHCNARGLLHGGVISALADNAMGLACVTRMEGVSALTVSLSVDFLSVGRSGQWLEVRAVPAKLGRTLAFADARIEADGEVIAKAAATFRIIEVAAKAT
jgi:uncharacterized protein (TIGR00369 family)